MVALYANHVNPRDHLPLVAPRIAAAEGALAAAKHTLALQRASIFGTPAIQVGVEARDPTGDGTRESANDWGRASPPPLQLERRPDRCGTS